MSESGKPAGTRVIAIFVAVIVIAATITLGTLYWRHMQTHPLSEDAAIQADVVHVSPAIPGQLVQLNVSEGVRVRKDDLLFSLDPEIHTLQLRQAEAQLVMAQAALSTRERQIRAEQANASIADEQIARAQSNLDLARKTTQRLRPLAAKGYVPLQQLDTAVTAERDARLSLTQAQAQADAARELVGELEAAQAAVQAATATVGLANKALSDTKVFAPNDGLVVGLNVSPGERLAPGQSLFTLINTEQWFATAFFKESELPHIQVGDCATAFTMISPGTELRGKVVSIGWGISSEDMISLPRSLPYVQKSLNWVRVAQRFPVRILLDSPPAELMRVGASASVAVRPAHDC